MTARRALTAASSLCLVATGCTGSASLQIIPIGPKGLSATSPMTVRLRHTECYYAIDATNNRMNIAMRLQHRSLFGTRFNRHLMLSLILDGLPAGNTRQYRADRNTLRAKIDAGYTHQRFASQLGNVLIWNFRRPFLRGRLRLFAKRQSWTVLTGWGSDAITLLLADFSAVHDPKKVKEILAATEPEGMKRSDPVPGKTGVSRDSENSLSPAP